MVCRRANMEARQPLYKGRQPLSDNPAPHGIQDQKSSNILPKRVNRVSRGFFYFTHLIYTGQFFNSGLIENSVVRWGIKDITPHKRRMIYLFAL